MNVSIERLDRVYRIQKTAVRKLIRIQHEQFRKFSSELEKFRLCVGRQRGEEFILQSLSLLKRYRFAMTAAPLGFADFSTVPPNYPEILERFKEDYEKHLPRFAADFANLVQSFHNLISYEENPYLAQIQKLTVDSDVTLLICESRFIPVIEEILFGTPGFERVQVVSESQLRRDRESYETLICFGARSWYPQYVFRTPRAQETILLTYSWIRGQDAPVYSVLQGSERVRPVPNRRFETLKTVQQAQRSNVGESDTAEDVDTLDPDLIFPKIDLRETSRSYSGEVEKENERVAARLFLVEGHEGVFFESTEPSSVLTIDLDEIAEMKVRRRPVKEIDPGLFVLLRADNDENGHDYIFPVADRILGDDAPKLRKIQKLWKSRLREAVRQSGMEHMIREMKRLGSVRANEINIGNWISERNIRPQDKRDFAAIMGVIGLPGDAEKIWELSGRIHRAHKQAGRLIRRILLDNVNGSDLTPLEKLGRMTFELEEIEARPIVAVRVVGISQIDVLISPSQANKLFDLGSYFY